MRPGLAALAIAVLLSGGPARASDPADDAAVREKQSGAVPNQAGAGQGDSTEGNQSTTPFPQEATRPGSLFPAWYLKGTRDIDPRLRPNAGLRAPTTYYPIKGGPLLYPNFSPVHPDFLGGQTTTPWSLRVSLGLFGVDGERDSSKFEEYRDVRDGTTAGVEAHYRNGNALFNMVGRQLGRADQDLAMDGGVAGKVLWSARYDETPHNYAFDARTLFAGIGTDRLTIADRIQADLQGSTSNLGLGAALSDYVDQQGVAVDLGLRRQKVGADVTLLATYPWTVKAEFSNESRNGVRPWSGSFGFGQFDEIPWPVDYDTREVRVSAERGKPEGRFYLNGAYRFSDFANHVPSLLWDNPFRLVDAPNPGLGNPLAGPATGRMSLYPSNQYHDASATFVVKKLPLDSTLSAFVSLGFLRQDEPLLPFSTNTAPVDTLSSPVNPSFLATDPEGLPRSTAQTAMDTQTLQARWTGALSKSLRFVAQYRMYRLVNNEEPFRFFMFVREDQDRRLPETQPGGTYLTVPADFGRHTASAELSYNFGGDSRLTGAYTLERLSLDHREIDWAHDQRFKIAFDTRRFGWLDLKTWYERSQRTTSVYEFDQYNIYQGNPAAFPMVPWLIKFDEAPFHRDEAQVMATAAVTDAIGISAHAQIVTTDFGLSELGPLSRANANVTADVDPNNQFGVRWDRRYSLGADVTYAPSSRFSAFADLGYDRWRYQQGARQWTLNGISDPYRRETTTASNSNWVANPRDSTWSGGFGLEAKLARERLRLTAGYTYSRSDGRHAYDSPVGIAANDVNAFVPAPFEDVDDIRWQTVNGEMEWTFTRALSMAAGYHYEKWEIDDYTYKGFTYAPVYNNGVALLMNGLLPPAFNANVAYVRVRAGF